LSLLFTNFLIVYNSLLLLALICTSKP